MTTWKDLNDARQKYEAAVQRVKDISQKEPAGLEELRAFGDAWEAEKKARKQWDDAVDAYIKSKGSAV